MIHVVIGTKAQLVKMAPVMVELDKRKIAYNFIFTGQHHETMDALRTNFDLPNPDVVLHKGKDITSIPSMFLWIVKILSRTLTDRKTILKGDKNGIVLVHGDTFSTLLGALIGRIAGLNVGHVESGLRSHNFLHPFPEEITRVLTFLLSNYFFCPGKEAEKNLSRYRGKKINTLYNTLIDSLEAARSNFAKMDVDIPDVPYCVVTTHRFENIFKKQTLEKNLKLIFIAAESMKTIFILHPVTKSRLDHYNLLEELENHPNIECRPRYDYFQFMKLVYHSRFLVTDGGSNQEECWYMGKPCLLLRKVTERPEGLDANVVISKYLVEEVKSFVANYERYETPPLIGVASPSAMIVESIAKYA
jgi:UDP-N-acetylglucosamine 2-epimerase (non-hydrolysing)